MEVRMLGVNSQEVKVARALSIGKKIEDESLFIIEGLWAVDKLIERKIHIEYFLFCPEKIRDKEEDNSLKKILSYCRNSYQISEKVCDRISDRQGADGFFFVCKLATYKLDDLTLKDDMLVMILDGLEQAGNIGSIIRSTDGAGGDFVIMTNSRVRRTHSRLIRASLGAAFMMPFITCEYEELVAWLKDKDFKIVLTDLEAKEAYYNIDYSGRLAIIAGNEYTGISESWKKIEGAKSVIIPMLGSVESLNVGFAASLVAYEARRYKTFK